MVHRRVLCPQKRPCGARKGPGDVRWVSYFEAPPSTLALLALSPYNLPCRPGNSSHSARQVLRGDMASALPPWAEARPPSQVRTEEKMAARVCLVQGHIEVCDLGQDIPCASLPHSRGASLSSHRLSGEHAAGTAWCPTHCSRTWGQRALLREHGLPSSQGPGSLIPRCQNVSATTCLSLLSHGMFQGSALLWGSLGASKDGSAE